MSGTNSTTTSGAVWITLLIRLTLGLVFLAMGINKFTMYGGIVSGITDQFAKSWLPGFLVAGFAWVLPVWEFSIGVFLLLGLWYRQTLIAAGVLLALLTFGLVVTSSPTTASNLPFVIVILIGLRFADSNRWYLKS